MRRPVVIVLALALLVPLPAAAADDRWTWPVGRDGLSRTFDPPAHEYAAGHRGVDVVAPAGTTVRSVAPGTVAFVGQVGGVQVVSIDHGRTRSTYQPVRGLVEVGDAVDRGQPIGVLLSGHSHCASTCLHLGRRMGKTYLDPLDLLGGGRFRLISPDGPPPEPPVLSGDRPADGPVTSSFGMRVHPVTGERKLHDGLDLGAACGSPVRVMGAGRVVSASTDAGYGKRVLVEHADGSQTGYAHLSSFDVAAGDRVAAREVIGRVGSTGLSTGCHLHLMLRRGDAWVDPAALL